MQLCYTDSDGIKSPNVEIAVTVYANPVTLMVNNKTIEVTAGEYGKVTDIFSKMGITAVDSRGNTINNVASALKYSGTVDINTPGNYELILSVTDSYGVTSSGVHVTISVKEAETDTKTE